MARSERFVRFLGTLASIAAALGIVSDGKAAPAVPESPNGQELQNIGLSEEEAEVRRRLVALRSRASALHLQIDSPPGSNEESGGKRSVIAQWYNWPNWPNFWNDWRNWPNFRWSNY